MYNEKTGKYDGISSVYRIRFTSAFVVDPDKPMEIPKLVGDEDRKIAFEAIKANTIKGVETRVAQDVPPGTTEASYPGMERRTEGLASRDFFVKTLDRPHYPDGVAKDFRGNPVDDQGDRIDKKGNKLDEDGTPLQTPQKPQQQVRNEPPVATRPAQEQ